MQILPLYAALLGLLFIFLSLHTIRLRRKLRIGVGDGGNALMLRAMRVHANFAEYVPFTLLLLGMLELRNAQNWIIHLLGITLCLGRCLHAYGVSQSKENYRFRISGMMMNFAVIGCCAILLLLSYFQK
jgi:uncharacterized membrane protein YecN with MAPEG domain